MPKTLQIAFTPPSPAPANGYIVKYRIKDSGSSYTTLSPNPMSSPISIPNLLDGTNYEGTIQCDCGYGLSTIVSFETAVCGCPPGFTASVDDSYCYQVQEQPATAPTGGGGSPGTAVKVNSIGWNNGGARVFQPGYPLNGEGTVAANLLVPHLWINGDSQWSAETRNTTDGRMNVAGIWGSSVPANEWVGFSRKVTVSAAKRVYVGMSADNAFRFSLNGTMLVEIPSTGTGKGDLLGGPNFNFWNIYPVDLLAGDNFIEMWACNFESDAGMAAEIYDMSITQLQSATTTSDLNIIFSTKDMVGQPFNLGTTVGYNCPNGYSLDTSGGGTPVCKRIITQACG